jgi:hypothetical protein
MKSSIIDFGMVGDTFLHSIAKNNGRLALKSLEELLSETYNSLKMLNNKEVVVVFGSNNKSPLVDSVLGILEERGREFITDLKFYDTFILVSNNNQFYTMFFHKHFNVEEMNGKYQKLFSKKTSVNGSESANREETYKKTVEFTPEEVKKILIKLVNKDVSDRVIDSLTKQVNIQNVKNNVVDRDEATIRSAILITLDTARSNVENRTVKKTVTQKSGKSVSEALGIKNNAKELLTDYEKYNLFSHTINTDVIDSVKNVVYDPSVITDFKTVITPYRQKIEFGENLDLTIQKMVYAIEDETHPLKIKGITKKTNDDFTSRMNIYDIKIYDSDTKQKYSVKLQVPALVDDKYFKIGGNLYTIHNELRANPILKTATNSVSIYTNYSKSSILISNYGSTNNDYSKVSAENIRDFKQIGRVKKHEDIDGDTIKDLTEKWGFSMEDIAGVQVKTLNVVSKNR